jgi:crotonobetainyl-CoA:carnitine CoA-transferase CaiB-like acyl-CoA transferase
MRGAFHTSGQDDTWIVLTVPTRGHADSVLSIVGGRPESEVRSLADADADAALVDLVRDWLGGLTLEDGVAGCTRLGLPHSVSRTPGRLFNDPHLNERGFYVEVTHPRTGTRRVQRPAWIRSGGFRIDRAPLLGEHTEQVLQTWLAMSSEQTADLNAQGVLR